jgi:hypothetical protein
MAKTKKEKTTAPDATAAEKLLRPTVISFRITEEQTKKLVENFEKDAPLGVRSTNQFARKVLVDYLAGRLTRKNSKESGRDLDIYP